ncbi:MAG TPA: hypothetical protein VFC41_07890 [Anaerovoracaceae bacterium]|jgi:hypothetical protein|nr:hypothetical protein [Anaerovoracaceae bacterium]
MSKKQNPKPTPRLTADDHRRKRTQILFAIMAVILIISWIASMIAVL